MLCIIWRVEKELNFVGKVGEKSRMTYPAKAPPRSRNFIPINNRNEADKFKNESVEQISVSVPAR